jgi:DNA polymerase-3 subunit delta
MAAGLSFGHAYRSIERGDFAAAYYFTGPEDVLKDELVQLLVERAVEPAARDFNVDLGAAGDLDGERLHALVETPPMLSERRVVVVRSIEHWRKNAGVWTVLERYLARPSPSTILVLVHGAGHSPLPALASAAAHVSVEQLAPGPALRWAAHRARRAGFSLDDAAAAHLVETVGGGGLAELMREIEKLAAAVAPGAVVDVETVARFVGVRHGETQADWVAAVLRRDTAAAVRTLSIVLAASGTTGVRLVTALGTALLGTRLARSHLDRGLPVKRVEAALHQAMKRARLSWIGDWYTEAERWTDAASRWSEVELADAIRETLETDRALKSSNISDDVGTLTQLVLMMSPRRAAA